MSEDITLDPTTIAAGRTSIDITSYVDVDGPDWGDAAIAAYMSDQQVGSSPVDYRIPNREVKIPLNLRTLGATSFSAIRLQLQHKVALWQREGGWIGRQVGSTTLYADVVNATLHLGGDWMQAYRSADVNAVLTVECLPDFYGDEVTLDAATATGACHAVLAQSGSTAVVHGNHPGRCRIIVSDTSGHDQLALLWGLRARHYDSASTASLFYEAEALTPLNGAATATLSGASGGSVIQHGSLPASTWVPIVSTNLAAGNLPLTHSGSYRVWARVFAPTAAQSLQLRLVWGVGSLSSPITNDSASVPLNNAFYLLDLGAVRIDAPPMGTSQWVGVIQACSTPSVEVDVDSVYLQPLDETAGKLIYAPSSPATSVQQTAHMQTGANDASVGTVAWSTPSNAGAGPDGGYATVTLSSVSRSNWLKVTNGGFAIAGGSTILGIQAVYLQSYTFTGSGTEGLAYHTRIAKGGTVSGSDKSPVAIQILDSVRSLTTYGGASDLWGLTWTPSDINDPGFGLAISKEVTSGTESNTWGVDYVGMTVWYQLASGLVVSQDAVIYGNQTAELRSEGMFRTPDGSVYGPVGRAFGDLPRLPPSGLEARAVEVFAKPTRSGLGVVPDSGLDSFTVQVKYRPAFLYVGE